MKSIWCLLFGHHYMRVRILDDDPIRRYAPPRCYDCGKLKQSPNL